MSANLSEIDMAYEIEWKGGGTRDKRGPKPYKFAIAWITADTMDEIVGAINEVMESNANNPRRIQTGRVLAERMSEEIQDNSVIPELVNERLRILWGIKTEFSPGHFGGSVA